MTDAKTKENYCEINFVENNDDSSSISLIDLAVGNRGKIIAIIGGRNACKRLNELGLVPGVEIEMVNKISSGPVMIRVKGSKLAIGRGLAAKVRIIVR
ncbi:MAG: ferrous iron transport protein A [Asgard group archaeon]|nr:ferrous iron transport protein A [Asgard group archaeon]